MKIAFPVKAFAKPSYFSMVAVGLSFSAWLFPSFGVLRKGFDSQESLDVTSVILLSSWYLLIFLSFFIGQKIGHTVFRGIRLKSRVVDLDSNLIYYSFSFLTAVGLIASYLKIFHTLSVQEIALSIFSGRANLISAALHDEDYSPGLVSLRYVVIYSASIALYRIIRFRKYSFLNLINLLMLAIIVINSRLMFVATLLNVFLLTNLDRKVIRIKFFRVLIVLTVVFLVLSGLNAARNSTFYESQNQSFAVAGVSEILAYLGSPFQAAIASSKVTDQLVAGGIDEYRKHVDVEESLNTNSAFVAMHEREGYFCWLSIAAICGFMGFTFEALMCPGKTIFILPSGAILYASSELWRLNVFEQGIFLVWFIIGIGLPLSYIGIERLRDFMRHIFRSTAQPNSTSSVR